MPSSQPDLPVITEADMLQFELLRADWTKEQMEAEGLEIRSPRLFYGDIDNEYE